jgi:hypothetical protein
VTPKIETIDKAFENVNNVNLNINIATVKEEQPYIVNE